MASTIFISNLASATAAEAMALREGLSLAIRMGCNNVVESNSLEAIQACTGEEIWWGDLAAIYADCVDLKTQIDKVFFIRCPRKANGVAHELARVCYLNKFSCNWVDEPPSFILNRLSIFTA
jgi:hypothetical protein